MTHLLKKSIRETSLQQRLQLSPAERAAASQAVCDTFFKQVPVAPGTIVAGYAPIRGELDARLILNRLIEQGYTCALPCTGTMSELLTFRVWNPLEPLQPGKFGIGEPAGLVVEPKIFLVPMAAFDAEKNRLGYGAGHYDRTLTAFKNKGALAVGLAYETQLYSKLPVGENDVKMDIIITDKKVYK